MNKALLIVATFAVLLFAPAEAGSNHKRADCSADALLADPYMTLSPEFNNTGCTVDGATRTCSIPADAAFSGASGWSVDGPVVVTNVGRESLNRYSCKLLESTTLSAPFSFPTESPYCALRWQDFTLDGVSYPYQVDIVDSANNTLGQGFFPHAQSTDADDACDFSGCNFDARNILGWTLPAGGTYTIRFTGTSSGEGVGAYVNDICVACMVPSKSPSSTTSLSASVSLSRTPSSSISQSPSSSTSRSASSSPSRTPSSSISQSPSSSTSRSPSSSISRSPSSSISQSSSSVPSQSPSSSISVSPSSSTSRSASSSISRSPSSSISQSASSSISQSASSSISQSSSASPSSTPIPSPCPSRSASPSPCPEPSPEPCDPCAAKHKGHGGDITININFN